LFQQIGFTTRYSILEETTEEQQDTLAIIDQRFNRLEKEINQLKKYCKVFAEEIKVLRSNFKILLEDNNGN